MARDLQEKIAAIRTDLDVFSEVEAFALMASGYRMTKREFDLLQEQHSKAGSPGTWSGYEIDAPSGDWPFRPLEQLLGSAPGAAGKQPADLEEQLKAASKTFFKAWNLTPFLQLPAWLLGALVFANIAGLLAADWTKTAFAISWVTLAVSIATFVIVLFVPAFKWLFPQEEGRNVVIKITIALLGYILSKVHLENRPHFSRKGKTGTFA